MVGVGNIDLVCKYSRIPITSVAQPLEQQSYEAAALLDRLMSGQHPPKVPLILPPTELVIRTSTDHLAITHPAVKRAVDYIKQHLVQESLDPRRIAQTTGISTSLLYTLFHQELACTPSNLVQRLRIHKARHLLLTTTEKIGTISDLCGFPNLRTFQRTFVRHEGLHPQPWRNAQHKN